MIEWVKQCYYQNETLPYELMEKDARDARLGEREYSSPIFWENGHLYGTVMPEVFFGLERMHTRKEMTRAVFESTGFIDVDMIAAIEETGLQVDSIRLPGGLPG